MRVTWDDAKNLANQKRHGVSFEEAQELFLSGKDYLEIFDEGHSDVEDRFLAIGPITRAGSCSSSGLSKTRTGSASSARAGRPEARPGSTVPTWTRIDD